MPSSKNLGFHAGAAREENTIPRPTWVSGSWYKVVDGHCLLGHHFFMGKGFGGWQVDYKLLGFHYRSLRFNGVLGASGFLNGDFVDGFVSQFLETPRHVLRRLVL